MKTILNIALIPFMLYLITSCEGFNSAPDPPAPVEAEILRIEVEPNPVQAGDPVTLTCVVKDSSAENLLFIWGIPGKQSSIPTNINKYSFIVDLAPGEYGASVSVDDTLRDGVSPNEFFKITVIK